MPVASTRSRIEWVWLHWSEYLLARDEFYRWFQKMTVALAPPVELQPSLKEKQWQLSHAQVLLNNADHQAVLLDRLLEEAASLFNRIGDPSVDEDAQQQMKAEYDAVKAKAQVGDGLSSPIHAFIPSTHPATHLLSKHLSICLSTIYHQPTTSHPSLSLPSYPCLSTHHLSPH